MAQCRLLRGRPQWQHTSYINKHRFQRPLSDWLLENVVTPEQLSRGDFRSSTTSYRFQLHRDAAFTRVSQQLSCSCDVTRERASQCAGRGSRVGFGSCSDLNINLAAPAVPLDSSVPACLTVERHCLQQQLHCNHYLGPPGQGTCCRVVFLGRLHH